MNIKIFLKTTEKCIAISRIFVSGITQNDPKDFNGIYGLTKNLKFRIIQF